VSRRIVKGWEGRYFEDFEPGDVYVHPYGRTVTEADNVWFTLLTMNPNEIHVNTDYSRETEWGRPLVNSVLTLAIVLGLSVPDVSQNAINLGFEEVKFLTRSSLETRSTPRARCWRRGSRGRDQRWASSRSGQ